MVNKKIDKNNVKIRYLEDSLLIDNKILVISDLHLGYEEGLRGIGLVPRYQYKETIEKLERIFSLLNKEKIKIEKILILGDLKHEFSENSASEWRETLQLLDFLYIKCKDIVIVRGNHDNYLVNILKKRGEIKLGDYYLYGQICFTHGDKIIKGVFDKSNVLVLGHLHPAITLSDEYKKEKYKCFLHGSWKGKEVYIIPSFIPLSLGYDLNNILFESGFTNKFFMINDKELKKFKVVVYNNKEDKVHEFGRLGRLLK